MRPGAFTFKMVAALALSSVFFAACSPEVTESDEYQELLAELDKAESERDLARSEIEDAESSRDQAQSELADSQARADSLEADLTEAEAALVAAQAVSQTDFGEPWPDGVKTLFVEGCTEDPEDISPEDMLSLCLCVTEELEKRVALSDFLAFSVALVAAADVDPVTGLPADIDEEFVTIVTEASVTCAITLGVF